MLRYGKLEHFVGVAAVAAVSVIALVVVVAGVSVVVAVFVGVVEKKPSRLGSKLEAWRRPFVMVIAL